MKQHAIIQLNWLFGDYYYGYFSVDKLMK